MPHLTCAVKAQHGRKEVQTAAFGCLGAVAQRASHCIGNSSHTFKGEHGQSTCQRALALAPDE